MAEKVTFTGSTYTIKAKTGFSSFNVKEDLYSWAKIEWNTEVDNLHKYPFPFVVIGGNDIGGGQTAPSYFFLRFPWVFETNGNGELHELALNLYAVEADGVTVRDPFNTLPGDSVQNEVSAIPGADLLRIISDNVDWVKRRLKADEEKNVVSNKYFARDEDTGEVLVEKDYNIDGSGNETLIKP